MSRCCLRNTTLVPGPAAAPQSAWVAAVSHGLWARAPAGGGQRPGVAGLSPVAADGAPAGPVAPCPGRPGRMRPGGASCVRQAEGPGPLVSGPGPRPALSLLAVLKRRAGASTSISARSLQRASQRAPDANQEFNLPCSDPFIASIAAICVRFEFELWCLVLLGAMRSSEGVVGSSTRHGLQVGGDGP